MIEWFKVNFDWFFAFLGACISFIFGIITYFSKRKALKNAKTEEEKQAIINEIKSSIHGFVACAEEIFVDVPKSGASKLMYVLNQVKDLCDFSKVKYDEDYWTKFIDDIIAKKNGVQEEKAELEEKNAIIADIKKSIPKFVDTANALFISIPDGLEYKSAYILKSIADMCAEYSVNVFDAFDWQSYVNDLLTKKE